MRNIIDGKKKETRSGRTERRKGARVFTALMLMTALVFTLTGCTTFDNFKRAFIDKNSADDADAVYIGVYEPESGEFEQEGKNEIKGIELANSMYGSFRGAEIKLIKVDNQSDIHASKTAIEDLIKLKPVAIIGSAGEMSSMAATKYVQKAKIPMITPSASNPLITEGHDYCFRACITDSQRGEGIVEYMVDKLGASSIGVVTLKNNSLTSALMSGFTSKVNSYAGSASIVMKKEYGVDDYEFKGLIKALKKNKPQAVFMPLGAEKADVIFTKVEKAGLTDIVFIGDKSWNKDDFIKIMKKHPKIKIAFPADSVINKNRSTKEAVTSETQKFMIEYERKYGDNDMPTSNALLGYDAYILVLNAMNNAKSLDPKDVRDALAGISDLRCVSGVVTFDENGNPIRPVTICSIEKGEIVSIYTTKTGSESKKLDKIEK